MVVRVCEDIVKLIQQKNLLNEYYGRKYIKVGEIEAKLNFKMRVTRAPIDDKDIPERQLMNECSEGELLIEILDREMTTHL